MNAPFPLIEIEGPPLHRGRSYGRQAGDRIARGLLLYGDAFRAVGDRLEALALSYLDQLDRFDRRLGDEIRGIAAGAEQPVANIVALNARTELTGWDAKAGGDECTAALALPSVTEGGKLLHGQNWDWRPDCAETTIILRIRADEGPDIITLCEAGQLARHGLNQHGIAVTANGLQTSRENRSAGLPSPFARRRMLMSETLAEAIGVVLNTPRSASHNLMLSQRDGKGRGEAVNFETTPEHVFWSLPQRGLLTHANHFKHPAAVAKVEDVGLTRHPESLYRDRRVEGHLLDAAPNIDLATFQRAFADDFGAPHAVCRQPAGRSDGSFSGTVATIIMDSAAQEIHVAAAPYVGVLYTRYGLGG